MQNNNIHGMHSNGWKDCRNIPVVYSVAVIITVVEDAYIFLDFRRTIL